MPPNPALGVLLHWIGGLAAASFYLPYRGVRRWAWESYWIVGGLFAWIVAPWAVAVALVPDVVGVIRAAPPAAVGWAVLFGMLWGVGGIAYGFTMRYLGIGLGVAVALGSCAVFGTLLPPMFNGTIGEVASTRSGQVVLLGVLASAVGIVVSGLAGFSKEREQPPEQRSQAVPEFRLVRGLVTAVVCGMMSACFAFGLTAGAPIAEVAAERLTSAGRNPMWQNLPVLVVVLIGGFTTNFVWCIALNLRNRTFGDYVGRIRDGAGGELPTLASASRPPLALNYVLCAIAGVTWYLQFFFYSLAQTRMGKQLEFSSWTLHMASIILFGTLWGLALREWRGTGPRTRGLLFGGLLILILSTVVVGYGHKLAG